MKPKQSKENNYVSFVRAKADEKKAWAQKALGDILYFAIDPADKRKDSDSANDKRFREAARYYRLAAEQGDAEARVMLARAHYFGEGVSKNKKTAAEWYEKAAKQGNASAQYALGRAYYLGEGVSENKKNAIKWYEKAAKNKRGHKKAQYWLAKMYWKGDGTSRSALDACFWFLHAAERKHKAAQRMRNEIEWNDYLSLDEVRLVHEALNDRFFDPDESIESSVSMLDRIRRQIPVVSELGIPLSAQSVFDTIWQSVVCVECDDESLGSGVVVHPNLVATNKHVIRGVEPDEITVCKARDRGAHQQLLPYGIIESKPYYKEEDFCLLHVDGLWGMPATIRKHDSLKVGETVYALGAPRGEPLIFSSGIISQSREGHSEFGKAIFTDTPISPGSSGGGLFDAAGNLVGITTAEHKDAQNLNIAVRADLMLDTNFD